jgi:hypothetical protein
MCQDIESSLDNPKRSLLLALPKCVSNDNLSRIFYAENDERSLDVSGPLLNTRVRRYVSEIDHTHGADTCVFLHTWQKLETFS